MHPEFVACELSSSFPMINDDARYRFCNFRPISPTHVPQWVQNLDEVDFECLFLACIFEFIIELKLQSFLIRPEKFGAILSYLVMSKVRGKLRQIFEAFSEYTYEFWQNNWGINLQKVLALLCLVQYCKLSPTSELQSPWNWDWFSTPFNFHLASLIEDTSLE